MERIVIVGYKPLPGKASELRDLLHSHVEILRQKKLATSGEPIIMESANGSFLEVFGWTSKEAIEAAHSNPADRLCREKP